MELRNKEMKKTPSWENALVTLKITLDEAL